MRRDDYKIFSPGRIGKLTLSNRLVRSATWDPCILGTRQMSDVVLAVYRNVARGGVGMIITGDLPSMSTAMVAGEAPYAYEEVRIAGLSRLVETVRDAAPDCRLIAQLSRGEPGPLPSRFPSPFWEEGPRPLTLAEIQTLVNCIAETIYWLREEGFDGVQLHAAHGTLLSFFLSPYTNRREDAYGGSVQNRVRVVREIVARAREKVSDFPILIKMNGTDYLEGGIDLATFPALARAVAGAGVDAIEVSGGMWECLARPEEDLGFRPVPAPESHTRLHKPEAQSYFLPYAERLDLDIPLILVGGNRDVERLEAILQAGTVDFISLCRPLISEPDLSRRWREGRGSSGTDCISCNACLYDMYEHPGRETPDVVACVFKADKAKYKDSQRWLATWVEENVVVG